MNNSSASRWAPVVDQYAYWLTLAAMIGLRALLTSDSAVQMEFAPHDDSLYVRRAFFLLNGEGFGPYDTHTLSKYPGISLWLAASRVLGIPYLLGINALYVGAGLYVLSGLRKVGISRVVCALAFAAYALNPVTLTNEWLRVLREPLGTGLFVLLIGAALHLICAVREGPRWKHVALFALTFAFALVLREDDRLLWALLPLLAFAMLQLAGPEGRRRGGWTALATILAAASVAITANQLIRAAIEDRYGLPIMHDYGEGEFPRLLAAIRSVKAKKDNRLVLAPQETLDRLRAVVPEFAPVVDRVPPVSTTTLSCRLHGVCTEWSNGWMPFWIKDAAGQAGLTPDLKTAQQYFRRIREQIEAACARRTLECEERGRALIPPFELRWTRALVNEFGTLLKMYLSPATPAAGDPPVIYNVPLQLGRIFQAVTMSANFDSHSHASYASALERPLVVSPFRDARNAIKRLIEPIAIAFIALGFLAMVFRWVWLPGQETVVLWVATIFFAFVAIRLLALAYVAVYLGRFDPRIVFAIHTAALLLAPGLIWETVSCWRRMRFAAPKEK